MLKPAKVSMPEIVKYLRKFSEFFIFDKKKTSKKYIFPTITEQFDHFNCVTLSQSTLRVQHKRTNEHQINFYRGIFIYHASPREVTNLVSNGKPSNSRLNPKAIMKSIRKKLISRIGAIFLASRICNCTC